MTADPATSETSVDGVDVDVLDTRTNSSVRLRARQVIYALPRFMATHVLEGYEPLGIDTFTYAPCGDGHQPHRRPPA